jgi:hypothetical protein
MSYNNDNTLFENLPDIVKPASVAKLLDISVKTIYDWKYRGKMRNVPDDLFIKLNRSLYIKTKVLRRWVTSGY